MNVHKRVVPLYYSVTWEKAGIKSGIFPVKYTYIYIYMFIGFIWKVSCIFSKHAWAISIYYAKEILIS